MYMYSREYQAQPINFMGFFQIRCGWLPWMQMLQDLLQTGDAVPSMLGLIAGHIYYYCEEVAPRLLMPHKLPSLAEFLQVESARWRAQNKLGRRATHVEPLFKFYESTSKLRALSLHRFLSFLSSFDKAELSHAIEPQLAVQAWQHAFRPHSALMRRAAFGACRRAPHRSLNRRLRRRRSPARPTATRTARSRARTPATIRLKQRKRSSQPHRRPSELAVAALSRMELSTGELTRRTTTG
eukprot:6210755-Pleurochrysis_carterae.AAC.1